jgi:hypothetical protein
MFCKQKAGRSFTTRVKDLKYGPIDQHEDDDIPLSDLEW